MCVGRQPTVLEGLGLDEVLYREAETRRLRRQQREEEDWRSVQLQSSKSKLSRNSRALCQHRLERELRAACLPFAYETTLASLARVAAEGDASKAPAFAVPRKNLPLVLESLGLLGDVDEEKEFCEKMGLFLDREETGAIGFDNLLTLFLRALERDAVAQSPRPQAATLVEECFQQLELDLLRKLSRLLANRLSRRKSPGRSGSASPSSVTSWRGDWSARGIPTTPLPGSSTFLPFGFGVEVAPDIGSSQPSVEEAAVRFTPRPRSAPSSARGISREASTGTLPGSRPVSARAKRIATPGKNSRGAEAVAVARCHLLYHQAIFASKESAQLEEEIKTLRQKEEMAECTFRPKLVSSARRASSASAVAAQPRNFETTVARMRNAYQRKVQRLEEVEHRPCGENYERLRRLGMQPFSFYWKDKARTLHQRPLMYIDVNVGNGRSGRISIREGDDLHIISQNFARNYQLDREKAIELEELLRKAYYANTHRDSPQARPVAPSQAPISSDNVLDYAPSFSRVEERQEVPITAEELSHPCENKADSGMVEDPELSFGGDFRQVNFQVALAQQSPPRKESKEPEPNERSFEQDCETDPHELSFDQRRALFDKSHVAYASEVPVIGSCYLDVHQG